MVIIRFTRFMAVAASIAVAAPFASGAQENSPPQARPAAERPVLSAAVAGTRPAARPTTRLGTDPAAATLFPPAEPADAAADPEPAAAILAPLDSMVPARRPGRRGMTGAPQVQLLPLPMKARIGMSSGALAGEEIVVGRAGPESGRALARAMRLVRQGLWEEAASAARIDGDLAQDIVEWHRLRAGKGDFDAVRAFLGDNPDWPGLPYLRKRTEGLVPHRGRAAEVLDHFADNPPQTGAGTIALALAYEDAGKAEAARDLVIAAWREMDLTTGDENYILERYGPVVKPHHEARLDARLWAGDSAAAERLYPRVSAGWRALAAARIGLQATADGVDDMIARVPDSLKGDPGLAFERFSWRARKGRNEAAIEILLAADGSPDSLGRAEAWANWRQTFARRAMRAGQAAEAYAMASRHGLSEGSRYADLEWLSGYLALTYLGEPSAARRHFERFRAAVATPISLGRAGYWEGRAAEAEGDSAKAADAYAFGARWQTSFYGLLAAEKAGIPMDPALVGEKSFPAWTETPLAEHRPLLAGLLLHRAGEHGLAERFLSHVAESQDEAGVGSLVDLALSLGEPHIALMVSKRAAESGIVVAKGYYPVVDLGLDNLPVAEELALSIARRESEFDPVVRSGAGAMGLMQVMPGTAREMAQILDVRYDPTALLSNPVYNARLGTTYLSELEALFGKNGLLVSAAYNAGPSRPIRWMRERGDPRLAGVDPIDWIEHIPFEETRNYVMRVTESLPVYRARLSGRTEPIRLSSELTTR